MSLGQVVPIPNRIRSGMAEKVELDQAVYDLHWWCSKNNGRRWIFKTAWNCWRYPVLIPWANANSHWMSSLEAACVRCWACVGSSSSESSSCSAVIKGCKETAVESPWAEGFRFFRTCEASRSSHVLVFEYRSPIVCWKQNAKEQISKKIYLPIEGIWPALSALGRRMMEDILIRQKKVTWQTYGKAV